METQNKTTENDILKHTDKNKRHPGTIKAT